MTPRIIFTDAVYFIRAIAASDEMYDRAFDIMEEFKAANANPDKQGVNLQTIACAYTLSEEDLTCPKYCRAMGVAGGCLATYAEDNASPVDDHKADVVELMSMGDL